MPKLLSPSVRALAISAVLLLAGCAHYRPEPMVAEVGLDALTARTLADDGLRTFMAERDPEAATVWPRPTWNLETLTLAAFYFHPDLVAARARWAVADAAITTAGQRPNPRLMVIPSFNSGNSIPTPWIVQADLDIPIETAGKRGKRIDAARKLSEAALLDLSTVAWNIRTQLRQAMLDQWSAAETESALNAQAAAQREVVSLFESQFQAGETARTTVAREHVALERLRAAAANARNQNLAARARLAAAVGVPVRALAVVNVNFDDFTRPAPEVPDQTARRQALLNRADILASLSRYAAAEATLRLEIARQYPDFRLLPGNIYDQGDNKWRLGLTVDLPVLNQNEGPIAEAEARRREQAANFAVIQARALGEVETALAGYESARAVIEAADRVTVEADRQIRYAEAAFAAGQDSRLLIATARIERTAAELTALNARLTAQQALGRLESALQIPAGATGFADAPPALSEISQ